MHALDAVAEGGAWRSCDTARPLPCRQQVVDFDRMSEAVAELDAETEPKLLAISTPRGFHCAGRIRPDQT